MAVPWLCHGGGSGHSAGRRGPRRWAPSRPLWVALATKRAVRLLAPVLLCVLVLLPRETCGAAALGAQLFERDVDARLLGWPQHGPKRPADRVYAVSADSDRVACLDACLNADDDDDDDDNDDDDDDDNDDDDDDENDDNDGGSSQSTDPWRCELRCRVLERRLSAADVSHLFDANDAGRYLILWESTAFAEAEHSKIALRELVRVASGARPEQGAGRGQQLQLLLYTYAGWAPASEPVLRWWTEQHTGEGKRRAWQAAPSSFGGWGRATLSLVKDGRIAWDVFDVVHSSKHRRLLDGERKQDGADERTGNRKDEDAAQRRYAHSGDLRGALQHARAPGRDINNTSNGDAALLPLERCLAIARSVLGEVSFAALLRNGKGRAAAAAAADDDDDVDDVDEEDDAMDAVAEHCSNHKAAPQGAHAAEEQEQEQEQEQEHDVDYEAYAHAVRDMGILGAQEREATVWQHTRAAFRAVVRYVAVGARARDGVAEPRRKVKDPPAAAAAAAGSIVVMASAVPVSGSDDSALLLSLCYFNRSFASRESATLQERFASNERSVAVNTDVFWSIVPCPPKAHSGSSAEAALLRCTLAVLADSVAANEDLMSAGALEGTARVAGLVLGTGFAGNHAQYGRLRRLWSSDPGLYGSGEFPDTRREFHDEL